MKNVCVFEYEYMIKFLILFYFFISFICVIYFCMCNYCICIRLIVYICILKIFKFKL